MARLYPGTKRTIETSYAVYGQDLAGEETILVRRKVGEPVDYKHANCKDLLLQRLRLAKASKDWSNLTWREKNEWHKKLEYVYGTKLLTGQQLYISEHIRRQRLNEDIGKPSPTPFPTNLPICLMLRTIGGQSVDAPGMHISEWSPPNRGWQGDHFHYASYLFRDVPSFLNNAHVHQEQCEGAPVTGQGLTNWWAFQSLHYVDLVFGYWVFTGSYFPFMGTDSYPVSWKTPHTSLVGDNYIFAVTNNKGTFQIVITPYYTPGQYNDWMHLVSNWSIPFNSWIRVDRLIGFPDGPFIRISRDILGQYTIEYSVFGQS